MGARLTLAGLLLTSGLQAGVSQPAPRTVPSVDLTQFAGTYYEIARYPNKFQKRCSGDVTATYALRPDGRIDVVNRCRTADGSMVEARGVAKRAKNHAGNARLKVRFAPAFLSWLPQVWGDYWIIGLATDYSYAVVGDPARQYLWILSRVPRLPDLSYRQAVQIAEANGFDAARLVATPQDGR